MQRDVAQLGSALRSGRRGRWFESSHPDYSKSFPKFQLLLSRLALILSQAKAIANNRQVISVIFGTEASENCLYPI